MFSYNIYLIIAGLFQPYQNGAPAVLLRKCHEHSRLIHRAPTNSNTTALTPDCRARRLIRFRLNKTLSIIIRWFDSLEKGARQAVVTNYLRGFYYLYRLQYSDLSWHSIHILVGIIE